MVEEDSQLTSVMGAQSSRSESPASAKFAKSQEFPAESNVYGGGQSCALNIAVVGRKSWIKLEEKLK